MSIDSTILIRIRHPDIDPEILTRAFGIEPEYSWKAGEAKPGTDNGATRRESYWVAQAPTSGRYPFAEGRALGAKVSAYVNQSPLERALTIAALPFVANWQLWSRLRDEGATAQLIVYLGANALAGFELMHEVMAMLSKFGLALSVEFRDAEEEVAA